MVGFREKLSCVDGASRHQPKNYIQTRWLVNAKSKRGKRIFGQWIQGLYFFVLLSLSLFECLFVLLCICDEEWQCYTVIEEGDPHDFYFSPKYSFYWGSFYLSYAEWNTFWLGSFSGGCSRFPRPNNFWNVCFHARRGGNSGRKVSS